MIALCACVRIALQSVTVVGSLPVAKYESDLVDSAKGSRDGEETDDYHYPTIQLPLVSVDHGWRQQGFF